MCSLVRVRGRSLSPQPATSPVSFAPVSGLVVDGILLPLEVVDAVEAVVSVSSGEGPLIIRGWRKMKSRKERHEQNTVAPCCVADCSLLRNTVWGVLTVHAGDFGDVPPSIPTATDDWHMSLNEAGLALVPHQGVDFIARPHLAEGTRILH